MVSPLKRLTDAVSAYLWALAIERIVCLAITATLLAVVATRLAALLTALRALV